MSAAKIANASRMGVNPSPSVSALRDRSVQLMQQASSHEERSAILAFLQYVWDAIRRLVNALCRALGMKGAALPKSEIKSTQDVAAQAGAVDARLAQASAQAPAGRLHAALTSLGFDELQRGLLLQAGQASRLDAATLARLSAPVFETSAKHLLAMDQRISRQRQDIATLAAPLIDALGGHPLLVEDMVLICRNMQPAEYPEGHAQTIQALLRMDDVIRDELAQREVVSQAVSDFTRRSLAEGVDLSALETSAEQVLGKDWRQRLQQAPLASVTATPEVPSAPAGKPSALERLRALAARSAGSATDSPPAERWDDDDDHDDDLALESAANTDRIAQ